MNVSIHDSRKNEKSPGIDRLSRQGIFLRAIQALDHSLSDSDGRVFHDAVLQHKIPSNEEV
jgi:hypothetical protein